MERTAVADRESLSLREFPPPHPLLASIRQVLQRNLRPGEVVLLGRTQEGQSFRPSDWAERLAGVMARFRPAASGTEEAHLFYSPLCIPVLVDGLRCVLASHELASIEPMAWDFVLRFARDNRLQTIEGPSP